MDVFEHLVAVAAPLNKAAMKGHKYIKREADGHGGWYYTYQHKTLPAGPHVLHVIFDANGEAVEHKAFGVTPFQRLREHALNHANANRDTHADVKPKQAFRSPKPNLGISRAEMPQIRSFHREEFLRGLAAKGAGSTSEQIPANELSPTQKEIHADVVSKLQSGELVGAAEKPILVSSDGYILDGHHRWAQTLAGGKPTTALNAVRINMPIRKLLDAARAFAKVEYSKSADALDALGALFKADGQMRAGHKYIRREQKAGGGYNYIYRDAQGRESKGEPQPTKDPAVGAEADPLEKTFEFVSLESLGLPEDTQKFWKSGDTYKPERNRLHEKAYSEEFDHVASVPKDKKPVVVVMMGAMSAGKGTVVDHLIGDNEDYVHVDPDRMKERLPEYKKAINAGTAPDGRKRAVKAAGTMAHEESSDMAEELRKRCIAGRKNFVLDGSGKNADKYGAKIKELKDAGYHVRLFMPHLEDLKEVNRRADNRGVKGGRFISKPLLEESHYVVPGNFEKLAPLSDDWALFDTSAEGHSPPPRAVWSSEGGKEKKIDPAFIERFQKTARERHAVSKERGWLKAWLERTLRKASAGKGLPPSSTLDEILGRFKKDRGETPDIDTGLEDSNDVAKARKQNEEGDNMKDDYAGPAQKPGTQAKPKPSANGPQKPGQKAQPGKPAASKGKPGEGPQKPTQYSTKTRGEDGEPMFAPQGDDERDPEAKFVVSDETPEGAHYENPKDSEHHDGFKQWKAARKQGLEGAAIPKHLVDAALQHTGKHHFDSDAHKLAYDDHLAHQEGSTGPKVPPSHASQKAGAKGKPKGKDPIDMVGKLAYEPSDEHVEGATPSGISRNGEEHETSGAAEKEDDDKYKKLYGAARKSVDPIDALAPLVKAESGPRAGHKYTSREPDGKGGWIYEYAKENPNLHTSKKPGAGSDSGEVASQRHYNVLKKIAREAADDSPEQDAAVQRHEKHAIEHKAKYGRAPDEHGGAAAHGGGKEAEAAAWRRIEQMAPGRARSVAMMQHYEKFDVPEGQIDTEDAEFDARPKGYNHLPTKKSFQQRGDTFDLRKGLYAFDLSNSTNTGTVPETLLGDYLASFIQEALEHEKREPAHRNPTGGENLYEYFATPILHELVQFIPRNENLARAAKKFKVTAEYIEAVMKDCGMIKPTTDAHKDHGDYWSSDWDSMSALGGDSARGPMQESLLASKQAPWVQPDPLATRSLRLAAEVSPLTMPERPPVVVRALPRVAPPAPMPTPNYDPGCLMHGDTGKMQMQHESFVRCSCH